MKIMIDIPCADGVCASAKVCSFNYYESYSKRLEIEIEVFQRKIYDPISYEITRVSLI